MSNGTNQLIRPRSLLPHADDRVQRPAMAGPSSRPPRTLALAPKDSSEVSRPGYPDVAKPITSSQSAPQAKAIVDHSLAFPPVGARHAMVQDARAAMDAGLSDLAAGCGAGCSTPDRSTPDRRC